MKNRVILLGIVLLVIIIGIIFMILLDGEETVNGLRISNDNRLAVNVRGTDNVDLTKEIVIENTTNEEIVYSIEWQDVENGFVTNADLTYVIETQSEGTRSIGISQIPVVDISILEDITIPAGATHTYEVVVTFNRSDDSEDTADSQFTGYLVVVVR